MHRALQQRHDSDPALLALLKEQRRTNRLLQGTLYTVFGFIAGALLMRLLMQWRGW